LSDPFAKLITEASLAKLAGERSFARGAAYFQGGALAETAWRKAPARKPGDPRDPDTGRFLITEIMETLARHEGDVDALVALKSQDLSRSYAFLEIAQLLAKAGRHDEALAWAERGWKSFADKLDGPLVEFLVGAYAGRKRHEEAANAAWHHFTRHPGMSSWRLLRKGAKGNGAWKSWREKALAHVRACLKTAGRPQDRWHWAAGGHSLLVEIFLYEGDTDAALAEARAGGCTADLWMKLASARAAEHPQDAIEIYQARIDPLVNLKHNQAYDAAAELVGTIKQLMERAGKAKEFGEWLAGVKAEHKAKRNFMKRLDALPGPERG
jgi:uncharacterized Zn finger protein